VTVDDAAPIVPTEVMLDRLRAGRLVGEVGRVERVEDGMQHVVLLIDDHLVARFARDRDSAASLRTEADVLARLAPLVTVPLPVPVHLDDDLAVHVMLHGEPTTRAAIQRLSPPARDRLMEDVAALLAGLAAAPTAGAAASVATTSRARLDRLLDAAESQVAPLLWRHQRAWLRELREAVDAVEFDHAPALIHGDLAPYHLLHDPTTGAITGVLDFGVAGVGDPAVDLACLLLTWGESLVGGRLMDVPGATLDRARVVAAALPLSWAVGAASGDAGLAVAHLGHVATDLGALPRPGGPEAVSRRGADVSPTS
jgi:aminoglycoside 2''-phosphotransferase